MAVSTSLPSVWSEIAEEIRQFRGRRIREIVEAASSLGLELSADGYSQPREYALYHHYTYAVAAAVRAGQLATADELVSMWEMACHEVTTRLSSGHHVAVVDSKTCRRSDDERYESPLYLHVKPGEALGSDGVDASRWRCAGEMIQLAGLYDLIGGVTGVVVTLESRGYQEITNSYTLKALPGTIFLDTVTDPVRLGELILHESVHTLLNDILAALAIELDPASRWFSPWKQTYRPAYGILHAGFAFGVLQRYFQFHGYQRDQPSAYARIRADIGAEQWDQARESVKQALEEIQDKRAAVLLREFTA
jgi:hypothetical protein